MKTVQTVRAMIAVAATGACRHCKPSAYFAGEALITCMGFIISFFVFDSFVFSIHEIIPPKVIFIVLLGDLAFIIVRKPPG